MTAGPAVHDVTMVTTRRRERVDDAPVVTLTARVAFGAGDVRLTVRPVVAVLADESGGLPRVEFHVEGGSSVTVEGENLAAVLGEAMRFARDPTSGSERAHEGVDALAARFDIAMSPFVTLEQPAFRVAAARSFVHPAGAVALRFVGEQTKRAFSAEHADAPPEAAEREAFDLQLASRRGDWLAALLEDAVMNLAPPRVDVGLPDED